MTARKRSGDPSQLQWLEEKHQRHLAKLERAAGNAERVEVASRAASEFLRSTVEWDRTFELVHEWLERARELLPPHAPLASLESYAEAAKGLVAKAVFFDTNVGKRRERSERGLATVAIALELCDHAEAHPHSWRIVRAAADGMAQLMLGALHRGYRLPFDPYDRLEAIATHQLRSSSPDAHVVEVYLDATAEQLRESVRRGEGAAQERWAEFRALVGGVQNVEVIAAPYCKAVAALLKAEAFADADWVDREVELTTGWWSSSDGWLGVRSKLHPHLGRLLESAMRAAPDEGTRARYQRLHDAYVEGLPNWE